MQKKIAFIVAFLFGIVFVPLTFGQTGTVGMNTHVLLHGIGNGGDNVNTAAKGTATPLHPQRMASIELYDAANLLIGTKSNPITYVTATGDFQGTITLSGVPNGLYTAKIKVPHYLKKTVPGILSVSIGHSIQLPAIRLVTGDTNDDNRLSILDYNMIIDCFSDLTPARSCADAAKKLVTDITDDGNVNQFDYNLLLRELSVQSGDGDTLPSIMSQPSPTTRITPIAVQPTGPSGEAMPRGDLPGWKQIFTDDFTSDVAVGSFPGTVYKTKWEVYLDGWPDTAGKKGAPSRYYPSKVISVKNGILNKYIHTENGTHMGAAILPILPGHTSSRVGQLYGKYTVRFRADAIKGFKTAWLLWPDSGGNLQYGEIDFPEGDLADTIHAYMHKINASSGGDQDAFSTGVTYTAWHTASTEWAPGKVTFILDGKVIGTSTSRTPNTPMHWVLQTESCLNTCPAATAAGNVQIDWVAVYQKI